MFKPSDTYPRLVVPIFSGGGTRLAAHAGILQALDELGISFNHLVGVSGGSIVASLLAVGMPLNDIKTLTLTTDFNQFRDFSLLRLLKDGGLSSGNKLERWLDEQLNGCRFKDLDLDLHILATDVNGGGPVVFNRENTPELTLSRAVRFSISIPLIFSFLPFNNHILADGAILSEDALFRNWAGDNTPTLCFRLKSDANPEPDFKKPMFPLKTYILMVIRTFMNAMSREYVHGDHWHNTIVVDTGKNAFMDFNISPEQKQELHRVGYQTAMDIIPVKFARVSDLNS